MLFKKELKLQITRKSVYAYIKYKYEKRVFLFLIIIFIAIRKPKKHSIHTHTHTLDVNRKDIHKYKRIFQEAFKLYEQIYYNSYIVPYISTERM